MSMLTNILLTLLIGLGFLIAGIAAGALITIQSYVTKIHSLLIILVANTVDIEKLKEKAND